MELELTIKELAQKAKIASTTLTALSTETKNNALATVADLLINKSSILQEENQKDLEAGSAKGLSQAMLDRLCLSDTAIEAMVKGLRELCALPDPVG